MGYEKHQTKRFNLQYIFCCPLSALVIHFAPWRWISFIWHPLSGSLSLPLLSSTALFHSESLNPGFFQSSSVPDVHFQLELVTLPSLNEPMIQGHPLLSTSMAMSRAVGKMYKLKTLSWSTWTSTWNRETRLGGSPHLSCKRDQNMDRRVTPSRRVTSPTRGPPPPRKQTLTLIETNMVYSKSFSGNSWYHSFIERLLYYYHQHPVYTKIR